MRPAIEANAGHEAYVYSFGTDPDWICAFQVYGSAEDAKAFLKTPTYIAYEREVAPLLEGPPEVEALQPQWIKAGRRGRRRRPLGVLVRTEFATALPSVNAIAIALPLRSMTL